MLLDLELLLAKLSLDMQQFLHHVFFLLGDAVEDGQALVEVLVN